MTKPRVVTIPSSVECAVTLSRLNITHFQYQDCFSRLADPGVWGVLMDKLSQSIGKQNGCASRPESVIFKRILVLLNV